MLREGVCVSGWLGGVVWAFCLDIVAGREGGKNSCDLAIAICWQASAVVLRSRSADLPQFRFTRVQLQQSWVAPPVLRPQPVEPHKRGSLTVSSARLAASRVDAFLLQRIFQQLQSWQLSLCLLEALHCAAQSQPS